MAEEAAKQPIIIKKVIKVTGGHGGGAWKIAYADFVTAMMAFFLLLWLLNSVTQEQLEGISNYFAPVSASTSTSGSGDILGGKTITEEGASESSTWRDSVTVDLPPPKAGKGSADAEGAEGESEGKSDNASEEALKEAEQEQFEKAQEELEETIDANPAMKQLKESLLIDDTPEGLRIQLVDQDGLAMFPSGGADMFLHTRRLMEIVSKVVVTLPQRLAVSGHTDAVPFRSDNGYSNWELSSDRANSARRALQHFGVPEKRFSRVVGKAATEPLLPDDPNHARNRRLSIILLRGTGEGNPAANGGKAQQKEDVLPGLGDIKKRQLEEQNAAPAAPAAPQLQLQIQAQ